MDIAIVAPCPIPYFVGGAENYWRGLQDHINAHTEHQAEIIKLPSREHEFWDLLETYRRFSELDLTGFDVVVSAKYPAWMVHHERHVAYVLHKLRGLYDTYHFTGLPERLERPPASVAELRGFMAEHGARRDALPEFFDRVRALRQRVDPSVFAFPGPFAREVVHFLDGIGLAPGAIHRYGAISGTVAERADYFPDGAEVFVRHPPSALVPSPQGRGSYLFTASRLDDPKRVGLIIEAMAHVKGSTQLRIAGTGPMEDRLREQAASDARIQFLGRVSDQELVKLYEGALAVVFVPYEEDYGLITVEAMSAAKPVITCTDSGGPTELIEHSVSGLIAEPSAEALGAAIEQLLSSRRTTRRMGRAAHERVQSVSWSALVEELLA
jgi:glycosyltransferase involved in cell wall biosynthesis